jgi:hypothetical protein
MKYPNGEYRQFHCYLIHHGRIAKAEALAEASLAEAVAQGRRLLMADDGTTSGSGIEIWERAALLYSDRCHASDTGHAAPVLSPFQTADSTMMPGLHRSTSPSLARLMFG